MFELLLWIRKINVNLFFIINQQQHARFARAVRVFQSVNFSQIWLMIYGTYVVKQKFNYIRISVLRDIKKKSEQNQPY